jgi:hypothetical protein
MTIEQIKDSYMFKIIKKSLMKEYPWIKDVEIEEKDFDDYKTVIFLYIYFDPYELGEQMDWEVARWVKPGYDGGTTLSMFYDGNNPDYRDLTYEVNDFVDDVRISPAIPDELKIPPPKNSWSVSGYISI